MLTIITENVSTIFAGLAIILSAVANWRVAKAHQESKVAGRALRKMDMLVEIELKNAAVGKLALVTAQKLLLLQDHPNLVRDSDGEIARLRNNLNLLQEFKESEREQEQLAEHTDAEDIELHTQALADVKRLRLSIEADVDKETAVYNQLFSQVFNA